MPAVPSLGLCGGSPSDVVYKRVLPGPLVHSAGKSALSALRALADHVKAGSAGGASTHAVHRCKSTGGSLTN